MPASPLTPRISERICKHMNRDHLPAVIAYARHYGGISGATKAQMISINSVEMELEVDGKSIKIAFDHVLEDSEDAHKTLVSMIKKLPHPLPENS